MIVYRIEYNVYLLYKMESISKKPWWGKLTPDLRELLTQSFFLLDDISRSERKFNDYSFIVFPAAKAYEGVLKFVFLQKGFITKEDYFGTHFRIGKALNPQIEEKYRDESVYDRIVVSCGGKELADLLWDTWRLCRNLVFHWFPQEAKFLSLSEAKERLAMIVNAIDELYENCLK